MCSTFNALGGFRPESLVCEGRSTPLLPWIFRSASEYTSGDAATPGRISPRGLTHETPSLLDRSSTVACRSGREPCRFHGKNTSLLHALRTRRSTVLRNFRWRWQSLCRRQGRHAWRRSNSEVHSQFSGASHRNGALQLHWRKRRRGAYRHPSRRERKSVWLDHWRGRIRLRHFVRAHTGFSRHLAGKRSFQFSQRQQWIPERRPRAGPGGQFLWNHGQRSLLRFKKLWLGISTHQTAAASGRRMSYTFSRTALMAADHSGG